MAEENIVILEEDSQEKQTKNEDVAQNEPDKSDVEESLVSLESLQEEVTNEQNTTDTKQNINKKLIIIGIIGGILLIAIVVLIIFLLTKKDKPQVDVTTMAKEIEQKFEPQKFGSSQIDDMIQKANLLYEKGNKFEALKIYENVAIYNQSLSNYNLGVSQMKQERYAEAIESFKNAISNNENISVSAINAAVSSLELNNTKNFNYYIELANSFLSEEANSPLYNYYYALINYYKGFYIEALKALQYPPPQGHYNDEYEYLSAKILSHLDWDDQAIQKLEEQGEFDASLTLGMLYAKNAQYDKAKKMLNIALKNTLDVNKIELMLGIIDLKLGNFKSGAEAIKAVYDRDKLFISNTFPIKATLNPELFDVNLAQIRFQKELFFDKKRRYEVLFYFAPYKVFNAEQTAQYIRKGGISLFLDDANSASGYLNTSGVISKVNLELSKAIADALNYKLKGANAQFSSLILAYPEHSVLHYNLALSYAQLGNFSLAAKHFITSYHLDPRNHLAGALGVIANDINNQNNAKLIEEINENLSHDTSVNEINLYKAIIELTLGNQTALIRWLETPKDQTALNIAFDAIIAKMSNNDAEFQKKAAELSNQLPEDVVANVLNFIAKFKNENIKKYVEQIQIYFHNKDLNDAAFYHGANIIKEQYIKLLQISGLLYYERDKLKKQISGAPSNVNLLQTLAYIDIFTNNFEESYQVHNRLIDEFGLKDANTLFLAAVSAIGSNHPQNAIALLELSKLTDPNSSESRVALGHLYQEVENIAAALIQYNLIKQENFKSEFFDFVIDYQKLQNKEN
ncbi:MAG: tetratricopeptide repeat protein [Campylobacter sp.]